MMGLVMVYCVEMVVIIYEEMGLLVIDKDVYWFDFGKFWSGDLLFLVLGYWLGYEIVVDVGG